MPTSARSCASALALLGQRLPVEGDGARLDRLQPVDGPAERGFPGPGGADDHHHLPAADGEIDVLEDVQLPEVLVDVPQLDQRIDGHTLPYPLIACVEVSANYPGRTRTSGPTRTGGA